MRTFTRPSSSGMPVIWTEYTDNEIRAFWSSPGNGHHEAIERGDDCVVMPCDWETAVLLSRLFIRELALPTCCHYDGNTLSMYCGAAGKDTEYVKGIVRQIVPGRAKKSPPVAA